MSYDFDAKPGRQGRERECAGIRRTGKSAAEEAGVPEGTTACV